MLTPCAKWTDDCQGKKDFDGPLVEISTRYWPRGGGYWVMHNNPGAPVKIEKNDVRPEVKPSAHAAINLRWGDPDEDHYGPFIEESFEGETESEVKAQVEAWIQRQMGRVVRALTKEFGPVKEEH